MIAGDHVKNSKYAISVARKAGAVIFALPEGKNQTSGKGEGEKREKLKEEERKNR